MRCPLPDRPKFGNVFPDDLLSWPLQILDWDLNLFLNTSQPARRRGSRFEVVRQEGRLGTIAPGAFADLLVVDGDPLKNLGLFKDGGPNLSAIMKGGRFHKNTL